MHINLDQNIDPKTQLILNFSPKIQTKDYLKEHYEMCRDVERSSGGFVGFYKLLFTTLKTNTTIPS